MDRGGTGREEKTNNHPRSCIKRKTKFTQSNQPNCDVEIEGECGGYFRRGKSKDAQKYHAITLETKREIDNILGLKKKVKTASDFREGKKIELNEI